jgi:uncharacterized protein (TIGR00255 family)
MGVKSRNTSKFGSGIASMTGYGRSERAFPGLRIAVELRTVNNRYCDIGMKIPRELNAVELDIRERIRKRLHRGRINVLINLDWEASEDFTLQLDSQAAKICHQKLAQLSREIDGSETVTFDQLLHFSDYFTKVPEKTLDDELRRQVFTVVDEALDHLIAMRREEGLRLAEDLSARIAQIDHLRRQIETLADKQPELQMEKMQERLEQLVNSGPLDPGRMEQELAILADRLDVTEECVRLASHCQQFVETLKGGDPVGKKLGFLLQELNREANTISSKSATAEISHLAVDLKEEIERIREQVQNLE